MKERARARARTGKSVPETDGMCTEGGELTKACPGPFNGIVLCPSQGTETRTVWICRLGYVPLMDVLLQEIAHSHLLVPGAQMRQSEPGCSQKSWKWVDGRIGVMRDVPSMFDVLDMLVVLLVVLLVVVVVVVVLRGSTSYAFLVFGGVPLRSAST